MASRFHVSFVSCPRGACPRLQALSRFPSSPASFSRVAVPLRALPEKILLALTRETLGECCGSVEVELKFPEMLVTKRMLDARLCLPRFPDHPEVADGIRKKFHSHLCRVFSAERNLSPTTSMEGMKLMEGNIAACITK